MQSCCFEIGRGRARALFFGVAGSLFAFSGPVMAGSAPAPAEEKPLDRQGELRELRVACVTGEGEACFDLAQTYNMRKDLWGRPVKGDGVKRNEGQAMRYYRLACEHGHKEGCVTLGQKYETGKGVRKNAGKAKQFYRRACLLGAEKACRVRGVQPSYSHLRD